MTSVALPNGRRASRIAFGCAGIGGSHGYAASRRCLAAAYESGLTHFDVAPSYGLGAAEQFVGRFLREVNGHDITLTTKAGIARPDAKFSWMLRAQSIVRPMLGLMPSVRRSIGNRARQSSMRGKFSKADLEASLHESLRFLGRDHIDIFLMHELRAEDISDELLEFLGRVRQEGKIGTYGFGSRRFETGRIIDRYPNSMPVVQTSWTALDVPLSLPAGVLCSFFGVLRGATAFQEKLQADPIFRENMKVRLSSSLETPEKVKGALILAALQQSNNGLVIVSSSKADRIRDLGRWGA